MVRLEDWHKVNDYYWLISVLIGCKFYCWIVNEEFIKHINVFNEITRRNNMNIKHFIECIEWLWKVNFIPLLLPKVFPQIHIKILLYSFEIVRERKKRGLNMSNEWAVICYFNCITFFFFAKAKYNLIRTFSLFSVRLKL